jgi:hypothetical protein
MEDEPQETVSHEKRKGWPSCYGIYELYKTESRDRRNEEHEEGELVINLNDASILLCPSVLRNPFVLNILTW